MPDGTHALRILTSYGFDIKRIRQNKMAVPAIFFTNLPRELTRMKNTAIKKELFFSTMLPPILKVNDIIRHNRKKLERIILSIARGERVSEADYYWLVRKLKYYKIKVRDVHDFTRRTGDILEQLLTRMNVIPPPLALAQAAQESGWGTSRFAQQGNALYGQWTWGDGCGMVPKRREKGKTHRMKCFGSIIEAVNSYMLNLNTQKAYSAFRQARRNFRDDQQIDVTPLIETLINYSQEGPEYIEKIKNIIRRNNLNDFQKARLKAS
ncbi:MAG: hypothetical protein GXP02_02765 [Alphaproteobacteria bacterium]|nr:hypothetical protein [Alphaproteobacteria bacterium]